MSSLGPELAVPEGVIFASTRSQKVRRSSDIERRGEPRLFVRVGFIQDGTQFLVSHQLSERGPTHGVWSALVLSCALVSAMVASVLVIICPDAVARSMLPAVTVMIGNAGCESSRSMRASCSTACGVVHTSCSYRTSPSR